MEETVTVAEDTMVNDGSNAGTNCGSATSLLVRNDPANNANRSAAFPKFNLPPIYPPDIEIATLCLRTRATPSGTAKGYVYGLNNNTWSEITLTWTNAPNLKKNKTACNKIFNRVIDDDGISDEAETSTFATTPNDADSDNDGLSDGTEVLVLSTNQNLNNIPTISNITERSIAVKANTGPVPVTIGDQETATSSLTLTRTSSNPALIPLSGIVFGGSGANRTVTITPAANQLGSSTVTVSVNDGVLTTNDTFLVTVAGTASQTWRFANFGTAANSGNAAGTFDADNDGEVNLLEMPCSPPSAPPARWRSLTPAAKPPSPAAWFCTVEWSDTLGPNSWSNDLATQDILTDNGTLQSVKATVPAGPAFPMRYARTKVMAVP